MQAPLPANESARLDALRSYSVLDTEPERAFDRLTALAAQVFDVPIALVSLVDDKRQWFKSCVGLDARETSRDVAFCAHAILADVPLMVQNTLEDVRFMDNPHVTSGLQVRFYAGAPLRSPSGHNLGTFCLIDTRTRVLTARQLGTLEEFAAIVVDELELRRVTVQLGEQAARLDEALRDAEKHRHLFEQIARTSPEVIYVLDLATRKNVYVNRDAVAQLGYTQEQLAELGDALLPTILHPDDLPKVIDHFADFEDMRDEDRTEIAYRVRAPDGEYRWFRARENVFARSADGRPREILGVASDITELKRAEQQLALLATTDEMTGVPNRRAFRQRLEQLVAEGERSRTFALAILDVDHFKRLNDTHGHQVGDAALAAIARTLQANVRKIDHVARYGGEEFCVLFVDVDEERAVALVERLRAAVAAITDPVSLTASFGVCAYTSGMGGDALVRAADAALYSAKHGGRNRVVAASAATAAHSP